MIKKRNLDPSLVNWINSLGLGLIVGYILHLVPESSSTSQYREWLNGQGVKEAKMFTDIKSAYAKMEAYRGDTLLVYPGTYLSTESLAWAKADTKIIGVGSPNQRYQPSTLGGGGIKLKCTTADVANILNITGDYVSVYGIGTQNTADDDGNLTDILISAKNIHLKECSLRGGTGATQIATAKCGVGLMVDNGTENVSNAGNGLLVERCTIGSSGNTVRTVGAGCMAFKCTTPGGGGFGMHFRDCTFSMYSVTSECYAIDAYDAFAFDRDLLFQNCWFYNYGETYCAYVFNAYNSHNTNIHLDKSSFFGFDKWATAGYDLWASNGPANIGVGGKQVVVADS